MEKKNEPYRERCDVCYFVCVCVCIKSKIDFEEETIVTARRGDDDDELSHYIKPLTNPLIILLEYYIRIESGARST